MIPIRFDKVRIAVKLKADEYGRCYEDMKEMGR